MTKEEWKKIEEALSGIFGIVELQVDGHKVSFYRQRISKNQLGIMTFVDGHYKGAWKEGDEEAKYLRVATRSIYSRKELDQYAKIYGKRQWKRIKDEFDKKYTFLVPIWSSVSGIRKHYEKIFKEIKLVKINGEIIE